MFINEQHQGYKNKLYVNADSALSREISSEGTGTNVFWVYERRLEEQDADGWRLKNTSA